MSPFNTKAHKAVYTAKYVLGSPQGPALPLQGDKESYGPLPGPPLGWAARALLHSMPPNSLAAQHDLLCTGQGAPAARLTPGRPYTQANVSQHPALPVHTTRLVQQARQGLERRPSLQDCSPGFPALENIF